VLLVALALAALTDLGTYAGLAGGTAAPDEAARPDTPAAVAVAVVQAVADGECGDVPDLVTDDAELPFTVQACLDGTPAATSLDDVREVGTDADDDAATVTVGVSADGIDAEVTVELRRIGDRWLVSAIR
jgi:hypothetical protein